MDLTPAPEPVENRRIARDAGTVMIAIILGQFSASSPRS